MSKHVCHWPGCDREVPAHVWGCRPHWFRLPKPIRNRIWATYRAGQEITKTPSREYVAAAQAARAWILANDKSKAEAHDAVGGIHLP